MNYYETTADQCHGCKALARRIEETEAQRDELLDALERVLSQYEALLTDCKISSVSTVSQSRAAIAKAKGG